MYICCMEHVYSEKVQTTVDTKNNNNNNNNNNNTNNNCKMRKVAISTTPNFPLGYHINYM